MNPAVYNVLHVFCGFFLVALTWGAFASPRPERRRAFLALSGILAVVMLVAGVGLVHKNPGIEFTQGWVLVKLGCWLVIAGLGGMAFRKPQAIGALKVVLALAVATALYMVYFRPF